MKKIICAILCIVMLASALMTVGCGGAETLKFGDKRRLKDVVFMPGNFTTVLVHDSQNLIGA